VRPKWDNLFWYQRASDEGKEQLENNTTKGFLKVLQESNNRLTSRFLKQFLGLPFEDAKFEYDTQVNLNEIPTSEHSVHLAGLSFAGENVARESDPRSGDGTVDGVVTVHSENVPTSIVIEVKTERDRLSLTQMGKYRGELGLNDDGLCHGVSWLDIYELLENYRERTKNDIDRFLLEEFTDYLELMRMVPFRGFDRDKLSGSGVGEYRKTMLRGVDQANPGIFSQALYESRGNYDLGDFTATSNQRSREVHLVDSEELENGIFQRLRHFSAGFWHPAKFSVQLYIPNRIVSNIVRRGSSELKPEFKRVMLDALSELDGIELTREDNPFYYLRYQRNIQQANDRERQTTTFHADSVIYMPGVDEASVTDRLGVIGRAVRETTDANIGHEKSFVIEKQIPYGSDLIEKKELVDWTLEYFQTLLPVYEYFAE
jgi:hypothetical protein